MYPKERDIHSYIPSRYDTTRDETWNLGREKKEAERKRLCYDVLASLLVTCQAPAGRYMH